MHPRNFSKSVWNVIFALRIIQVQTWPQKLWAALNWLWKGIWISSMGNIVLQILKIRFEMGQNHVDLQPFPRLSPLPTHHNLKPINSIDILWFECSEFPKNFASIAECKKQVFVLPPNPRQATHPPMIASYTVHIYIHDSIASDSHKQHIAGTES